LDITEFTNNTFLEEVTDENRQKIAGEMIYKGFVEKFRKASFGVKKYREKSVLVDSGKKIKFRHISAVLSP
jgi:hypothetical protein